MLASRALVLKRTSVLVMAFEGTSVGLVLVPTSYKYRSYIHVGFAQASKLDDRLATKNSFSFSNFSAYKLKTYQRSQGKAQEKR